MMHKSFRPSLTAEGLRVVRNWACGVLDDRRRRAGGQRRSAQ